jgi:hypothetical protein
MLNQSIKKRKLLSMKKILCILVLLSVSFGTLSSCTEEEVKPQTEGSNSGGSPIKE